MEKFVAWLAGTHLSAEIQNIVWIIPAVQTIHILAICVVMSSVLLLNLRLVGLLGGGEPVDAFTRRYLPWVWTALVILFFSGITLIVGEPARDLLNPIFWIKMSLLVTAIVVTFILERPVSRNALFWETPNRRHVARLLAVVALTCWVCIVFFGRWIAYTYTD